MLTVPAMARENYRSQGHVAEQANASASSTMRDIDTPYLHSGATRWRICDGALDRGQCALRTAVVLSS